MDARSLNLTLDIDGKTIHAPGFTAEEFDRAIHRAFCEDLEVTPTTRRNVVAVASKRHPGVVYLTTRATCTCPAGRQGRGCKHRALAILMHDALGYDARA